MEHRSGGGDISIATAAPPPTDHDQVEDHHDCSPVGSPELAVSQLPQPDQPPVLSDDLRRKIIKQVEYYFSDENLPNDKFMMKYVTENKGFVPIGVIASFKKMKKLTRDVSWIVTALKESSLLVVSSNGKRVKRLHPLPVPERDPMVCTVIVENLPEDHSVENLRQVFGKAGNVLNITLRDPHDGKDTKQCTVAEKLIRKLHALVEYDTVEAAEKAVATLNNGEDWRYGLHVKLLKKMNKPGQQGQKKVWRESEPEKKSNNVKKIEPVVKDDHGPNKQHDQQSSGVKKCEVAVKENHGPSKQHVDPHAHVDEHVNHPSREKGETSLANEKNVPRGKNGGRGRHQKYHPITGQGHGQQTSSHHHHGYDQSKLQTGSKMNDGPRHHHGYEPAKPPPGPKMPDGTRGFAMGRGRPLATE